MSWAGPGRAEMFEKLVGRAGLGREMLKSDGLGRAAWAAARPLNM